MKEIDHKLISSHIGNKIELIKFDHTDNIRLSDSKGIGGPLDVMVAHIELQSCGCGDVHIRFFLSLLVEGQVCEIDCETC